MASARSFPELSFAGFAGEKTDYVTGPTGTLARITNDVVTYLHPDHLGSAQAGTRANGTVAWREQYTPFGEQLQNPAANDNLGGFTGHIKDSDTGLNYMQARYYDPVIGRFLSVDPVGFLDTQNPSFFNRYRYCSNDPVNCTDPTGQSDLFKKFFDFGASDAAATASRSMESLATSEGMNPNGATDMMNDALAAGAIGQLEGMANGAANIVDIASNEVMSSAMSGDTAGVTVGVASAMIPVKLGAGGKMQPYNPQNGQYLSPDMNKLGNSPLGQFTQGLAVGYTGTSSVPFPTKAGELGAKIGAGIKIIRDLTTQAPD